MLENQSEAIIIEKMMIPRSAKIALGFFLCILIGGSGYAYYLYNKQSSQIGDEVAPSSFGLDAAVDANSSPQGQIFFTVIPERTPSTAVQPMSYRYDVVKDEIEKYSDSPIANVIPLTGSSSSFVLAPVSGSNAQVMEPYWYSSDIKQFAPISTLSTDAEPVVVHNLALSPDQSSYLFNATVLDTESNDISLWKTSIHSFAAPQINTIPNSMNSRWLPDGKTVLYISTDGLYTYNAETKKSQFVYAVYPTASSSYSDTDEIAVSADGSTVILTRPTLNLIVVLVFDKDEKNIFLRDTGWISTEATSYSSPIISPDGKYYAVVAKKITTNKSEGKPDTYTTQAYLEVRPINSTKVVQVQALDVVFNAGVYASAWTNN